MHDFLGIVGNAILKTSFLSKFIHKKKRSKLKIEN
jgi:hypothetical protein